MTWPWPNLFVFLARATFRELSLTRALKGFYSSVQTYGLVDVDQPLPWFSRVGQEKILSLFLKHSEEHAWRLSRFRNILQQDLTPLHVKITKLN